MVVSFWNRLQDLCVLETRLWKRCSNFDLCPVKSSYSGALDPGPLQDNFFFQPPFMSFNFTNMPAPSCPLRDTGRESGGEEPTAGR